jgi:hypothetical protein
MSIPNAYKLRVNYRYDETQIPYLLNVAYSENETFQHCSKCGIPYVTNTFYRNRELCTYCSGYSATVDDRKQEKHRKYMRGKAKQRRIEE